MRTTSSDFAIYKERGSHTPYLHLNWTTAGVPSIVTHSGNWPFLASMNEMKVEINLSTMIATVNDLKFSILNSNDEANDLITLGLKIGGQLKLAVSFMDRTTGNRLGFPATDTHELIVFQGRIKSFDSRTYNEFHLEAVDVVHDIYTRAPGVHGLSTNSNLETEGYYPFVFGQFRVDHHVDGDDMTNRSGILLPNQDGSLYKHHTAVNVAPINKQQKQDNDYGQVSYLAHSGRLLNNTGDYDCGLKNLYSIWAYDDKLKQIVKIPPFLNAVNVTTLNGAVSSSDTAIEIKYSPASSGLKLAGKNGYIQIDSEIIKYDELTNDGGVIRATGCTRGALSTTAASYAATESNIKIFNYFGEYKGFGDVQTRIHFPLQPITANLYIYPTAIANGYWGTSWSNPERAIDKDSGLFAYALTSGPTMQHLYINYAEMNLSQIKKHRLFLDVQLSKALTGSGTYRFRAASDRSQIDLSGIADYGGDDLYDRLDLYPTRFLEPAKLTGGKNATDDYNLWALVTDGAFWIELDGTGYEVSGIDFSGVSSMEEVATRISTGIFNAGGLATVLWEGGHFTIQSTENSTDSSITFCYRPETGTDISGFNPFATSYMDCGPERASITPYQQETAEAIMQERNWTVPQLDFQAYASSGRYGSTFSLYMNRLCLSFELTSDKIFIECDGAKDTASGDITATADELITNPLDIAYLLTKCTVNGIEKETAYTSERGERTNFAFRGVIRERDRVLKDVLSDIARQAHFTFAVSSEEPTLGTNKLRLVTLEDKASVYDFAQDNMFDFKVDQTGSHNDIQVLWGYDWIEETFTEMSYANRDESNHSEHALDMIAKCLAGYNANGEQDPLIVEAQWIVDQATAENLLQRLVWTWAEGSLLARFKSTLKAAHIEIGDVVTVTHPQLGAESGEKFMIIGAGYKPEAHTTSFIALRLNLFDIPADQSPADHGAF